MAVLPDFDPARFTPGAPITNPYFPLTQGRVLSYQGSETDPETGEVTTERNDLLTTAASHEVRGVQTTVVRDTVYEDDLILEDTFDWYAQDDEGNVWYFGEIVVNYEYDDEGNFLGVDDEGAWSADDPGNAPGWQMKARPEFGPAYYLEFAPGNAEDESILVETGLSVDTPFAHYDDVIRIIDSSALFDGIEFKYYARDVGQITELELNPDGSTKVVTDLYRNVDLGGADSDDGDDRTPRLATLREGEAVPDLADVRDLAAADFAGTGAAKHVSVIGAAGDSEDALGAYLVDTTTGAIGEARILFEDLPEARGLSIEVEVPEGQALGLFLVRAADDIGIDLEDYEDGGLRLVDLLNGAPATLHDPYAATVTDAKGNILPIQPLHALGADDGANLINPGGSLNAIGLSSKADADVALIGFENRLASSPDYDGDFNDAIVAVGDAPLDPALERQLREEAGTARYGTDGDDRLVGGGDADWLIGLAGADRLRGVGGDDRLEGGTGRDAITGGAGDDWLTGGGGGDWFRFAARHAGDDSVDDFGGGDRLVLAGFGPGFGFDDLDNNGNGRVGAGDADVAREDGALILALGELEIELAGVRSLGVDDFAFVA